MKNTTTLKQLGIKFLSSNSSDQKMIVKQAEKLCKALTFKNKTQFLKSIECSYFCGVNSSSKIIKGESENYLTVVLYLSASKNAGIEVCSFACAGCRAACLVESGRALMEKRGGRNSISLSRLVKTWIVAFNFEVACAIISAEIESAQKKAKMLGKKLAVRLNGTSDLDFSVIYAKHKDVQFYDYTKNPNRVKMSNYDLTFSYSMATPARLLHYKEALNKGLRLAIPIVASDFKEALKLEQTYSMDKTDLRFLDKGRFGLLKAKRTNNTEAGIKNNFFLSLDQLKSLIAKMESQKCL